MNFPFELGDAVSIDGLIGVVCRLRADEDEEKNLRIIVGVRYVENESKLIREFDVAQYEIKHTDELPVELIPKPVIVRQLAADEFMRRFTLQERIAIREAANTDGVLVDAQKMLDLVGFVRLDHPDTKMFIGYMVQKGLLSQTRANAILS